MTYQPNSLFSGRTVLSRSSEDATDGIHSETRLILPFLAPLYAALAEPTYALTRFVAGAFLVPHGMSKLFGIAGGTKQAMIDFFSSIGLEPATLLVNLVGSVEFFAGILIALGLLTRPAAAAATVTTATAALYFHLPLGFYVEQGGVEFSGLWTIVLLMIAVRGGGRISLDALVDREF
jgi:putative oxidoreductase